MRRDDLANGLRRRRIVEQNVAAAIDLDVDEARCKPKVGGQISNRYAERKLRARSDFDDIRARDDRGRILMQADAIKQARRDDRVQMPLVHCAHRVRVTFCRWRG